MLFVGVLSLLLVLTGLVDSGSPPVSPVNVTAVPIVYRLACGQTETCDGRTEYCNDKLQHYEHCQLCKDVCDPVNGVYTECQKVCKVALEYQRRLDESKVRKDEVLNAVETAMRPRDAQIAELTKEIDGLRNGQVGLVVALALSLLVLGFVVVALVCAGKKLSEIRYTPIVQPKEVYAESAYGTGNNSPENRRKSEGSIIEGVQGGEVRQTPTIITTPTDPASGPTDVVLST